MNNSKNWYIILIFWFCSAFVGLNAQSYIFGPKIGPSLSTQRWGGFDRQALIAYHAAIYIESYDESSPSSLYAQLGYHVRGSAQRTLFNSGGGNLFRRKQTFQFQNLAFSLGAKKILDIGKRNKPYYILAIRGEYTLNTNLDQYLIYNGYFPVDAFVKKINYGFTVGGGFQYQFSEFVGAVLEFSISPDVSKQYDQPPIPNVVDPYNVGNSRTLPQQEIRNLTFEISLGLRLLRKVEYID